MLIIKWDYFGQYQCDIELEEPATLEDHKVKWNVKEPEKESEDLD
jgi:hypothetical protein